MSVTFVASTGSTTASTSVLSATGSFEISGASRCDDIAGLLRDRDKAGDERGVAAHDLACADHDDDLAFPRVADVCHERLGACLYGAPSRRARPGEAAGGADQADRGRAGRRGFEKRASRIACHAFLPRERDGACLAGTYEVRRSRGSPSRTDCRLWDRLRVVAGSERSPRRTRRGSTWTPA